MTAEKIAFAHEQGADFAILLDRPDLKDRLRVEVAEASGGAGADVVVENLGGAVFDASLRSLAWCGRIVVVGFAAAPPATLRSNYLLIKNIAATGLHWSDYRERKPDLVRCVQQDIFALWREGRLKPAVTEALALRDAPKALRRIADRRVRGKIVLLTDHYTGPMRATLASGSAANARV